MKNKLLLATLLLPLLSQAQTQEIAVEELEELIINKEPLQLPFGEHTRSVQVITKEEIKQLPVTSINELLAYINGVDIRQRGPFGSQADVSIDGGTFEQTMVLWNGMKMGDAQTAHHSLNLPIPFEIIERIEVLKGPASRIFGINSLTGAINIVTKTSEETYAQVHAYIGSSFKNKDEGDGNGKYAAGGYNATIGGKTGNVSHLMSATKEETNGQRYNTAAANKKIMYQGQWKANSKNQFNWMSGYIHNQFGANGYYAAPRDKESFEIVETLLVSIDSKHQIGDVLIKPRISNRYNEDDYRFIRQDISKFRSLHYSNALMGELHALYPTEYGDFTIGYEIRNEKINSTNLKKHERTNHGWFAEYKKRFADKLYLSTGAYWNYNTDYGFQWYPGVDLSYEINNDWKASASIGSSQRIPSFTDLYLNQRPGNIGNESLKPEAAWQYEFGIYYTKENKKFQATVFQRNINDFIDWIRTSTDEPYQPHNLGNQIMRGVQAIWQQKIELSRVESFGYKISYQYLSPKTKTLGEGGISKYSLENLKHQAIVGVNYRNRQIDMQLQSRFIERELNDPYTVIDVRVNYHFPALTIYAQGNNLINAQYKEAGAVPMPTRWLTMGAIFKMGIK